MMTWFSRQPTCGFRGARRVATDRYPDGFAARYDMGPAIRDFGCVPTVTIEEGLTRLASMYAPRR